MILFIYPE